jgi:predicted nucleic acid-binding protein
MIDAVADTGPILHLSEIGQLICLHVFNRIILPDLVAAELLAYGVSLDNMGIAIEVTPALNDDWQSLIGGAGASAIHPADAQVIAMAQKQAFTFPVLTDDLALRRRLEMQGATVVGSFGVLVRAHSVGILERQTLKNAVDNLFTTSSLHTSQAFRAYAQSLLLRLP